MGETSAIPGPGRTRRTAAQARVIYNQAYERQWLNASTLPYRISIMSLSMLPSATGAVGFRHSFRVFSPLLMSGARRRMATGAPINNLSSKGTKEPLHKGVEGPHISAYFLLVEVMGEC